jgi:hypothetical protein
MLRSLIAVASVILAVAVFFCIASTSGLESDPAALATSDVSLASLSNTAVEKTVQPSDPVAFGEICFPEQYEIAYNCNLIVADEYWLVKDFNCYCFAAGYCAEETTNFVVRSIAPPSSTYPSPCAAELMYGGCFCVTPTGITDEARPAEWAEMYAANRVIFVVEDCSPLCGDECYKDCAPVIAGCSQCP